MSNMDAFDVYLNGYLDTTVYFLNTMTAAEVKQSLIDHDGFDARIVVRRRAKK